ncbi:MAG: tetratricopeptide repeat protein [Deltaproteobacteria bacterium]|nr:tetratricopeptide repeat protein [Deltaproteobacteria bacterium]
MEMNRERIDALAPLLAGLMAGEISLAQLVDLDAAQLAKILNVAIAQLKVRRTDDAIEVLEALVALDRRNYVFHLYLGLAHEQAKDFAAARAAYDQMLACTKGRKDLSVQRCEGLILRGRVHALLGDVESASADVAEARRHLPKDDAQLQRMLEDLSRVLGEVVQ